MKLFLIHTGFKDDIHGGVYEYHSNFLIVAQNASEAKYKVNQKQDFINRKMHIDSIQEINMIDGHQINLIEVSKVGNTTEIIKYVGQELKNLD